MHAARQHSRVGLIGVLVPALTRSDEAAGSRIDGETLLKAGNNVASAPGLRELPKAIEDIVPTYLGRSRTSA